jgi:hypothetical protein
VAWMQSAHGGNQADNTIFVALLAREFFHPGNSSNEFHEEGGVRRLRRRHARDKNELSR